MIPHSKTTINTIDLHQVNRCLKKGFISTGELNKHFREKLQKYLNIDDVRLTSSGTLAWFKILNTLSIKINDEVLIPNYICRDVLYPVINIGAKPVLYDNTKGNWISSFIEIEKKITPKTRVILINHVFGIRFPDIEKIKNKYPSLYIVEDCCHALSPKSNINGKSLSSGSICSFYSFNATKLIAAGEGGAVASNDKDFMKEYDKILIGDKLSDLNCSLGLTQLNKYTSFLEKRREIAHRYIEKLPEEIIRLKNIDSIFFRFPVWTRKQSAFLNNPVVSFRKGVDFLLSFILKKNGYLNSESAYKNTVSIPIYPSLKKKEIDKIIKAACDIYDKY